MNTSALILMLASYSVVTGVTAYFFYKVLRTPAKPDEVEPPVKSYDAT